MTIQTPSTENLFVEEKRLSGIIIICLILITFFVLFIFVAIVY